MRGKLFLATGVGHCGTAWLAKMYNDQPGILGIHEAKHKWAPSEWDWTSLTAGEVQDGIGESHAYYFRRMESLLKTHPYIVDSHSFVPAFLPDVAKEIEVEGVLLLVRNGIQNVHSLYQHHLNLPVAIPLFSKLLDETATRTGMPNCVYETDFEMWCQWWRTNFYLPFYLARTISKGATAKLESLLNDVFELKQAIWWMNSKANPKDETLKELQETDVNRKIAGDRHPRTLWRSWNEEQREAFAHICGEAMSHFEYEIPNAT